MKYVLIPICRFYYALMLVVFFYCFVTIVGILMFIWDLNTDWVRKEIADMGDYFDSADVEDYHMLTTGKPNEVYKTFWDYVLNRKSKYSV